MGLIESSKVYSGRELETIFFRPTFTGQSAQDLGIRVLYNMPMPTTIHLWSPASNVLKPYQTGWQGGESAVKEQKTIDMKKVKDLKGNPLLLFAHEWSVRMVLERNEGLKLSEFGRN